jgi:hypothetical protein
VAVCSLRGVIGWNTHTAQRCSLHVEPKAGQTGPLGTHVCVVSKLLRTVCVLLRGAGPY